MTSRGRYIFVMPAEFADWMVDVADQLHATVVLYRAPNAPLERWDGRREALEGASRVYLAQGPVDIGSIRADKLAVGLLGWVQLDVPRVEGRCLLISQVGTKSDWFDAKQRKVMDNPAALRLFNRFWSKWKKHLMFPVWAKNRESGAEAPYRDIGYSKKAAEWFERGGQLRQEGVDNIDFVIRPGSSGAGQGRDRGRKRM
jgi:hypothetical protein